MIQALSLIFISMRPSLRRPVPDFTNYSKWPLRLITFFFSPVSKNDFQNSYLGERNVQHVKYKFATRVTYNIRQSLASYLDRCVHMKNRRCGQNSRRKKLELEQVQVGKTTSQWQRRPHKSSAWDRQSDWLDWPGHKRHPNRPEKKWGRLLRKEDTFCDNPFALQEANART